MFWRAPGQGFCRAALIGLWLALLCVAARAAPAAPAAPSAPASPGAERYTFRQAPLAGLVTPSSQGLTLAERQFLQQLPVVRVGLNLPDNRPYEVIDAAGEISGIQIEILTHVAQALGVRLQPVVLNSFPEALAALRDRQVDLLTTVGYQPERERYMAYTLGTAPNPGAIIGRAADDRFATAPTLNGRRVAIERDYVTQFYVRRLYPEALVIDHPDTASALRAVALGEDDFYVGSLLMALDRLQRDRLTGLAVKRSLVYATGLMHFGVRNDWPLLASALSKSVAALRQTPVPALQDALGGLTGQPVSVPGALSVNRKEQAQLASRSVLRAGAVRGLSLLNEATPSGGHSGIAADYLSQISARLGVAVDVLPFDSVAAMLDALRSGQIHLAPLLTRTPERAKEFSFSDPYLEMPYHVIARSDAPMYWDLASLRGKRLALTAQHPLREFLAQRYPDILIVDAPPGEGAMDMVAAGKADAAVEAKLYANLRISTDNNGVLRQVARVDEIPAQFHFAASRDSAVLIPLINRALADIPEAERDRLYRRWVAVEINPGFAWRRHLPWLATAAVAVLLLLGISAAWMRRLAREVQARSKAEARLRKVANSLPGVVFQALIDDNGRYVEQYLSESAEAFLGPGATAAPDLSRWLARHMSAADAQALQQGMADCLATGLPFKQTFSFEHPQYGPRWLHCAAVARPQAGGGLVWTGYLVDVSSERELQARLLDAVQAKNLFVATASHELRAPLQVITLALQRLGLGALNAEQRQSWQLAQQSSEALAQLIDDVLDLARFEAGRVRLQPSTVALAPMLTQLAGQHRLAADARGLSLALVLQPGLPAQALLDALRLRQLLANLLGNAIKYTARGSVTLTAGPLAPPAGAAPDPTQAWICLSVRDTGAGISAEQQRQLFEPFSAAPRDAFAAAIPEAPAQGQTEPTVDGHPAAAGAQPTPLAQPAPDTPATLRALDGLSHSTGLGLAICKRLVQAMQGEILVLSQPGQGTEVRVHLPLALPQGGGLDAAGDGAPGAPHGASPGAAPGASREAAPRRQGAVLLVDDDAISQMLMAEMLRRAGLQVLEASNAEAALQLWRRHPVAAVISDRHMPGQDGPALLQRIGQEAADTGRPCPARVLCSGDAPDSSDLPGPVDATLTKPVAAPALLQLLARLGVGPEAGPHAGVPTGLPPGPG